MVAHTPQTKIKIVKWSSVLCWLSLRKSKKYNKENMNDEIIMAQMMYFS